jgi:hypothetical protein
MSEPHPSSSPPPPPQARPIDQVGEQGSPLSEAHYQQLRQVLSARLPIQRGASTARASAISILIIAALCTPFVLLAPGWLGVVMLIGISYVGVCEYMGSQHLQATSVSAAGWLARNQLLLLGLITFYCVVQMMRFDAVAVSQAVRTAGLEGYRDPSTGQTIDIERILNTYGRAFVYGFYGLIIVLSIAFQGGLAWYYQTRVKHLKSLQAETPPWIQRLLAELRA